MVSILVLKTCLFIFYCWFSIWSMYLSKKLSISSRLSILLAYSCLWEFLTILCISTVSVLTSPLSFHILLIWVLFLFILVSLATGLSIMFIFSENYLLVSFIFTIVFFISFIYICPNIWFFLLILTLGFVCFFNLVASGVKIGCLFEIFFLSPEAKFYCYKLPF